MRTLPILHLLEARRNDGSSVRRTVGFRQEEFRVACSTPSINCIEVEIARVRVRLWKAPRNQVGKDGLELRHALAEAAGGLLRRHIARFNVKTDHLRSPLKK